MREIIGLIMVVWWLSGIAMAPQGVWYLLGAICVPPYAWYIVVEYVLKNLGVI